MSTLARVQLVLALVLAPACGSGEPAILPPNPILEGPNETAAPTPPAPAPAPFQAALKAAVQGYAEWPNGLVATEPDRAPTNCRAPSWYVEPVISAARTSDDGHGKKLYYLYAKDVQAYRSTTGLYRDFGPVWGAANPAPGPLEGPVTVQPVGQLIVKESWTDVAVAQDAPEPKLPPGLPQQARAGTWVEGGHHVIGERAALFVMMKVADHASPDTDAGWVYGTLTPDATTVTSSGRLPKCMGCHERATHDRLFGPKQ